MEPYRTYNQYIRERYGKKGYRLSIDGGFSCPNRSADRREGGCSFCDESGSRPAHLCDKQTLIEQIDSGIKRIKSKYRAELFFLYFQSYTSTLADMEDLENIYETALQHESFTEMIVSTRPDCLADGVIELLCRLKKKYNLEVWVELGLQTVHDKTLVRVNRGHDYQQFQDAYTRLKTAGIKCAVHLILGLPGENETDMYETLKTMTRLRPDGIKFHNLHIPEKSPLFLEYQLGELSLISNTRYVKMVAWAVERLPPDTVILRLSTDTPVSRSGKYPGQFWDKHRYARELDEILKARGTTQGIYYDKTALDFS